MIFLSLVSSVVGIAFWVGIAWLIFKLANRSARWALGDSYGNISKFQTAADLLEAMAVIFVLVIFMVLNALMSDVLPTQLIVFVAVMAMFALAYYRKSPAVLLFGCFGLIIWAAGISNDWEGPNALLMFSLFANIGAIFLLLARWHRLVKSNATFNRIYVVMGLLTLGVMSLWISSADFLDSATRHMNGTASDAAVPMMVWGISALLAFGGAAFAVMRGLLGRRETALLLVILFVFAAGSFLSTNLVETPAARYLQNSNQQSSQRFERDQYSSNNGALEDDYGIDDYSRYGQPSIRNDDKSALENATATGVVWFIIANVMLAGEIVWMLSFGYRQRDRTVITFGFIFLIIAVLARYVDIVYSYVSSSLFFFGLGLLLLVIGLVINARLRSQGSTESVDKEIPMPEPSQQS